MEPPIFFETQGLESVARVELFRKLIAYLKIASIFSVFLEMKSDLTLEGRLLL